MKVRLVQTENEERKRGKKKRKRTYEKGEERWVDEYPEHATASMQKLRYNAARFSKEQTITNLILVRQRNEVVNDNWGNQRDDQWEIIANEVNQNESQVEHDIVIEGSELIDEELEFLCNEQLTNMKHSTMTEMEPREKLRKTKVPTKLKEKADSILGHYLRGVDTIPEITDKVYICDGQGSGKPSNENRRVRKITREMKVLRQSIARAGNKLYMTQH